MNLLVEAEQKKKDMQAIKYKKRDQAKEKKEARIVAAKQQREERLQRVTKKREKEHQNIWKDMKGNN